MKTRNELDPERGSVVTAAIIRLPPQKKKKETKQDSAGSEHTAWNIWHQPGDLTEPSFPHLQNGIKNNFPTKLKGTFQIKGQFLWDLTSIW